jgi:GxxExxY protein
MTNILHKELSFEVMRCCFAVHSNLGNGFLEIVYKDALQIEFDRAGIAYHREHKYEVLYKGVILPHYFCADFVVEDSIILEVKGQSVITDLFMAQTLNYLHVSGKELGIIAVFGGPKLASKRIVL